MEQNGADHHVPPAYLGLLTRARIVAARRSAPMDQLVPSLAELITPFRACFRAEVFQTFQVLIAGWIICVARGPSPRSGRPPGWPPGGTTTPPTPSSAACQRRQRRAACRQAGLQ